MTDAYELTYSCCYSARKTLRSEQQPIST